MPKHAVLLAVAGTVLLALPAAAPSLGADHAAETCEVEIAAEIAARENSGAGETLEFEIVLTTGETCAEVEYDLVLEQDQPNRQIHRVRLSRSTRVRDGEDTQTIEHVSGPGYALMDYEVRPVSCSPCSAGVSQPDS
jgi:hypothetical protein